MIIPVSNSNSTSDVRPITRTEDWSATTKFMSLMFNVGYPSLAHNPAVITLGAAPVSSKTGIVNPSPTNVTFIEQSLSILRGFPPMTREGVVDKANTLADN